MNGNISAVPEPGNVLSVLALTGCGLFLRNRRKA
ncbi:MAG: PEP-CTERM sorting domain-containing protein [Verrucomicrobiota bacterium]